MTSWHLAVWGVGGVGGGAKLRIAAIRHGASVLEKATTRIRGV